MMPAFEAETFCMTFKRPSVAAKLCDQLPYENSIKVAHMLLMSRFFMQISSSLPRRLIFLFWKFYLSLLLLQVTSKIKPYRMGLVPTDKWPPKWGLKNQPWCTSGGWHWQPALWLHQSPVWISRQGFPETQVRTNHKVIVLTFENAVIST